MLLTTADCRVINKFKAELGTGWRKFTFLMNILQFIIVWNSNLKIHFSILIFMLNNRIIMTITQLQYKLLVADCC